MKHFAINCYCVERYNLLHSANILIDGQCNGKLGDFGFALQLPEVHQGRTVVRATSFARTEGYYAPELHHGRLSPKCDVYSYGVVSLNFFKCLICGTVNLVIHFVHRTQHR